MMQIVLSLITGMVAAGLTQIAVIIVQPYLEDIRRSRSLKRIQGDPLYKLHSWISELRMEGTDAPLMYRCQITQIDKGRIEITDDLGRVISFTGREFEKLHPIFESKKKQQWKSEA